MANLEYVRVTWNNLPEYLARHGLQVVAVQDTGGEIYMDVEAVGGLDGHRRGGIPGRATMARV